MMIHSSLSPFNATPIFKCGRGNPFFNLLITCSLTETTTTPETNNAGADTNEEQDSLDWAWEGDVVGEEVTAGARDSSPGILFLFFSQF
jgi:hypothetical protein